MDDINTLKEPWAISSDSVHNKIFNLTKSLPVGKCIDFPSGAGLLSYRLTKTGHNVSSMDIDPESYKNSSVSISKGDLNKRFSCKSDLFDYAFCIEGPEHVENLYFTFREFFRVLKNDGLLFLSLPNYTNLENRLKFLFYGIVEPVTPGNYLRVTTGHAHINRPPYALLRMALESAGFRIKEITYDKDKKGQKYWLPLYLLIRLITFVKGKKGQQKYWLKDNNQWNVCMGGYSLIIIAQKKKDKVP